MTTIRLIRMLVMLSLVVAIPACMRQCVPQRLANPHNLIDLCAAPDAHAPVSGNLTREVADEFRRRSMGQHPPGVRPYHFLALSSGGLYGAFGAGVLKGWADSGTRPEFDVVTGISTGALMSTFAFLGSKYDDQLREDMVGKRRREFLRRRFMAIVPGGSLFSSRPLVRQIRKALTPEILAEVAAAHAGGRRLYVATTNLDSRRLIIWDMGAIASRGTPDSIALYRNIVLASSSIPLAFPPVHLKVEIDGVCYDELHVDGGVSDEVIFRAFMVGDLNHAAGLPGALAPPGSTLHVVSNGKLYTDPKCIRGLLGIVSAAAKTVLSNKSRDELYRIYLNCLETGVAFQLAAVPQDLDVAEGALSVTKEDQELLYKTGYKFGLTAATGENWRDAPPGSDPSEQALPRAGTHFRSGADSARCAPSHP